jgi:hypothetical protein
MSYRGIHSFLWIGGFSAGLVQFDHRNCLSWTICCRMMYLHLNLMQEIDIWVEPPKSVLGIWCRHHWSWWRGTILWSLGTLAGEHQFCLHQWSRWLTFIAELDYGGMIIYGDDCGHQLWAIGLHRLFRYLAFLHYMVCWWFQRHITHWLYWRLCNVEQNFCSPLPFLS